MKGPTHNLIGVASSVVVARQAGFGVLAATGFIVAAYGGSKLPDKLEGGVLAHRGPTHRLWAPIIVGVVATVAVLQLWTWDAPWHALDLARPTVTMLPVALTLGGGLAFGYVMHLVADGCTKAGTPIGRKRKRNGRGREVQPKIHLLPASLRVTTGGASERVVVVAIKVGLVMYLAFTFGVIAAIANR